MRYKIKAYLARKFRKQSTKSEMIMWNYLISPSPRSGEGDKGGEEWPGGEG